MDVNELFGKPSPSTPMSSGRPVAVFSSLITAPLIYGMEKESAAYHLVKDKPASCATRLQQGEVHLALIPSIDYALGKGGWLIVPDLCIGTKGAAKTACLFFNKDIHDFRIIAIDKIARSEEILLKILLNERYQNSPEYIYTDADLDAMLTKADAALLVGDAALQWQQNNPHYLDLGEEWLDFSGLPFVSAFWCGHELMMHQNDTERVQASFAFGQERIQAICEEFAKNHPLPVSECLNLFDKHIDYIFTEEQQEGLKEFYRYAFYLGYIDHIPELHFWPGDK